MAYLVERNDGIALRLVEHGAKASFNLVVLAQLQGEKTFSVKLLGGPASANYTLPSSSVLVPTCSYRCSRIIMYYPAANLTPLGNSYAFQKVPYDAPLQLDPGGHSWY